ncbi:PREDICTED: uncharacterized protein LOC104613343 [Nelumbo nucifera]|uniref:Uncharacterized protein LOC104613343 n=1 Tax=Nelumbo nucifera TaxID=4432 RepID=A0A1U8BQ84_NELNU|nr:PREDICTED: uncharacterized protein LOC104613343 [Nelumbo nucifera]
MIKRQFYKQEHADRDVSDSSSSSSDSDSDVRAREEEDETEEEIEAVAEEKEDEDTYSPSPGSGYVSEDSSGNDVNVDSSGILINDDDDSREYETQNLDESRLSGRGNAEKKGSTQANFPDFILKCKSVFKCRLCPRIVCLSEETLKAHFKSKRHARSEKLLSEGRLKLMLNSDGEIEEEQETHAERHARIVAVAEELSNAKKKNRGRQRQRQRLKRKKTGDGSDEGKRKQSIENPTNKRHKDKD